MILVRMMVVKVSEKRLDFRTVLLKELMVTLTLRESNESLSIRPVLMVSR